MSRPRGCHPSAFTHLSSKPRAATRPCHCHTPAPWPAPSPRFHADCSASTHEEAPGCLARPLKGLRPVLGTHTPHHLLLCPLHGLSHGYRACALITRNSEARSHQRPLSLSSQAQGTQAEDERRWGRKARPRTQPGKEGKKERERGSRRPRPGKHHSPAWVRSPARALHAQGGSEDSAGAGRGQRPPPPQDAKALLCQDKQDEWSPERLQSDPACCPWQLHCWKWDQEGARRVARRTRVQGHTRQPRVQEQSLKQPKCPEGGSEVMVQLHVGRAPPSCRNQRAPFTDPGCEHRQGVGAEETLERGRSKAPQP